ncbi:DUF6544 family protein [Pollutibacter soli]|uniref:DUF6544 family protein n=1 Tax=Pollutibacter soli TaxID=3034157 RepID=UPI003013A2BB
MKFIFAAVIFIHGLIHFMGFAKAFNYGEINQLMIPVSRTIGALWLLTGFLFVITAMLFFMKKDNWGMVAAVAVVISEVVIIMSWKDARFGTIPNVLILAAAFFSFTAVRFENTFRADVQQQFLSNNSLPASLLTEADLQPLPAPVQRYLHYTGVVNKPKVKNVRIVFEGQMRSRGKDWFKFRSVQYNFLDEPARLFFIKGKMFGVTVPGYHHYLQQKAVMDIRLFGLFGIVKMDGEEMNKTETVTFFNDMCLMAPATLIDKRIRWEAIDDTKSKAIFTNGNISITAILYFNEKGQLINFTSDDRYDVNEKLWIPFSTLVHEYKKFENHNLLYKGDAVWHYPEGEFVYGKFLLKDIEYNGNEFKN